MEWQAGGAQAISAGLKAWLRPMIEGDRHLATLEPALAQSKDAKAVE